ncbi:MAG: Spy/CpxP family protein refolding chaperone [Halothiobacillaceae bacterium]
MHTLKELMMRIPHASTRNLLAACLLAISVSALAAPAAPTRELSAPIVELAPVVKAHAAELKLDAAQQAWLKEWMATMPAKRQAVEQEALALRARLRELIIAGGDLDEREALIRQIGDKEVELLTMRAKCVDAFREKLTPEQFTRAVALYRKGSQAQ